MENGAKTMTYQNKVVLVTGGAKGVGRGISECYLAQGATVVVCGRTAPENAADPLRPVVPRPRRLK